MDFSVAVKFNISLDSNYGYIMSLENFKFIGADLTAKTIRDSSGRCWKIIGLTSKEAVKGSDIESPSEAGFQNTFACCAKCEWTEIKEPCDTPDRTYGSGAWEVIVGIE